MWKTVISAIALICLTGCYYTQKMTVPIGHIQYTQQNDEEGGQGRRLLILLPGLGDRATAFEKHGFVELVQNRDEDFDVIAVEAHFKYYQARTVVDRIREDIVLPAMEQGYKEIFMGGNSLGGFGSLLYLKHYPDDLKAILILAPYLAERQDYGYLLDGKPVPEQPRDRNIWPWLSNLPQSSSEKIYLAYGEQDKFSESNALLRSYLPESNAFSIPGKHRWTVWEKLWPDLLSKAFPEN